MGRIREINNYNTLPWLCAGDFNEILYPWEKVGRPPAEPYRMHSFREFLNDCSLMDVVSKGCAFPTTEVFALPAIGSDHSPLLIS